MTKLAAKFDRHADWGWERHPVWQTFLERIDHFQRPSVQRVIDTMQRLPDEARAPFIKRLRNANRQHNAVEFEKHALGVWLAMARLETLLADPNENLKMESRPLTIGDKNGPTFNTFSDGSEPQFRRAIIIDDHFTIERGGLPFIYKTKYTPTRMFGSHDAEGKDPHYDQNQLLKFDAAVSKGLISGAAVEIRGLIDPECLNWACGASVFDRSPIPNVQLIYNLVLPSGAEYRFTLKKCEDPSCELQVTNDYSQYTDDDMSVVRGIENATQSANQLQIIEILSGQNLFTPTQGLAGYFGDQCKANPAEAIKDSVLYDEYIALVRRGIWRRAREIAPDAYNLNHDTVSSPENAKAEHDLPALRERIENFQHYLRTNPDATYSRNYLIGRPEEADYAEKISAVTEQFAANIAKARNVEDMRRAEERADPAIAEKRRTLQWDGPDNGYGLGLSHIMLDSIIEVLSKDGNRKFRNYDREDGRFMTLPQVMDMLQSRRDEHNYVLRVNDPLKKAGNCCIVREGATPEDIAKAKRDAIAQNINRALTHLKNTRLHGADKERYLDAQGDIAHKMAQLVAVRSDIRNAQVKMGAEAKKSGQKRLPEDHPMYIAYMEKCSMVDKINDRLWETLSGVISPEVHKKKMVHTKVEESNIIRVIYAVDHKGDMLFEEEPKNQTRTNRRASHSELVGGGHVFGAGEVIFTKPEGARDWGVKEINNGSGHYRPPTASLKYVLNAFMEQVETYYKAQMGFHGISKASLTMSVVSFMQKMRLTDSIARGRALPDMEQPMRERASASHAFHHKIERQLAPAAAKA